MTRLFIDGLACRIGDEFVLQDDNFHYVANVLRVHTGERLVVVSDDGKEYEAKVIAISKKNIKLSVVNITENTAEPPYEAVLYQSVSKGERMDITIQKSVELGCSKIVPVFSDRCIVRDDGKSNKIARWQKIAMEASRQSQRSVVPVVANPVGFNEALREILLDKYDLKLLLWEDEKAMSIKDVVKDLTNKNIRPKRIAYFVGPEGGYEEEEVEKAKEAGVTIITLGKRILRTETASPALLSMLMYEYDM